jgi:hypothetical protein
MCLSTTSAMLGEEVSGPDPGPQSLSGVAWTAQVPVQHHATSGARRERMQIGGSEPALARAEN